VDIVLLTLSGEEESAVMRRSVALRQEIEALTGGEFSMVPVILFGPFEAPVYRAEGRYRMRIVIKCRLNRDSRALFGRITDTAEGIGKQDGVSLSVDFNPSTL
jgi:primosomal protein N'